VPPVALLTLAVVVPPVAIVVPPVALLPLAIVLPPRAACRPVDKHRCQLGHYDRSALAGIYVYLQKCMTGSTVSANGDIRRTNPRLHFPTYVLALTYGRPGWGLNPVPMVGGW
jgi:hypothetical protein